jgi:hypothetical protein
MEKTEIEAINRKLDELEVEFNQKQGIKELSLEFHACDWPKELRIDAAYDIFIANCDKLKPGEIFENEIGRVWRNKAGKWNGHGHSREGWRKHVLAVQAKNDYMKNVISVSPEELQKMLINAELENGGVHKLMEPVKLPPSPLTVEQWFRSSLK